MDPPEHYHIRPSAPQFPMDPPEYYPIRPSAPQFPMKPSNHIENIGHIENDEKSLDYSLSMPEQESPIENDESPIENDESPIENDESLIENDESPIENDESPIENDESPIENDIKDEKTPINPNFDEKADLSFLNKEEKNGEPKEREAEKEEQENLDATIKLLQETQDTDTYITAYGKKYDYLIREKLAQYPESIYSIGQEGIKVHMCMYSMVLYSYKPFVQYLICLSNNEYDFPSYIAYSDEYDEEKWFDDFKSEFFKIFPDTISKYFIPDMNEFYKGIIEMDDSIYVFFDVTTIPPQLIQDNPFTKGIIPDKYIWSPIHEFYNLRTVCSIPINHKIEELFYRNDYLLDIREHRTNQEVPIPYVLFLCEKESSIFSTSSYKNSIKNSSTYSILLPKVNDEEFGEFFFFSSVPLDTTATNLRRFAVFINDEETLFQDKESISEEESYKFIYCYKGDTQFWIVKSPIYMIEL
jgi:hypothetical protein